MKKSGIIGVILTILLSGSAWAAGIWEPNKFGYAPQLTTQGTPDYGNISTSQARIDARLGKQIWVGDPNYGSTIPACVNAIGSNSVILHYSGPQAISTNLTIPANITLAPENGAILTIASGVTLTINGPLQAGPCQVFSCSGTGQAVFGPNAVKSLLPQWWGAKGDGATDDTAALTQAFNCMNRGAPTGQYLSFGAGPPLELTTMFYTTGNFTVKSGTGIYGLHRDTCGFVLGHGSGDFISGGSNSGYYLNCISFKSFTIKGTSYGDPGYSSGMHLTNVVQCLFENDYFWQVGSLAAIELTSDYPANCISVNINNTDIQLCQLHGVLFDNLNHSGSACCYINECRIQGNGGVGVYSPAFVPINITVSNADLEGNREGCLDICFADACCVINNHGEGGSGDASLSGSAPFRFGCSVYSGNAGLTTNLVFTGNSIGANPGCAYAVDFGYADSAPCQASIIAGNGLAGDKTTTAGMAFGQIYGGTIIQSNLMTPNTRPIMIYKQVDELAGGTYPPLVPGDTVAIKIPLRSAGVPPYAVNYTLIPAQDESITVTGGMPGQDLFLLITTSGTSCYNLTFGSGFDSTGTLATGTADGKNFLVHFRNINGIFYEVSRTAAMKPMTNLGS